MKTSTRIATWLTSEWQDVLTLVLRAHAERVDPHAVQLALMRLRDRGEAERNEDGGKWRKPQEE